MPVKGKATQSGQAISWRAASWSMEKLKLNTRITMRAKKSMDDMVSRVRHSLIRSFHTTQRIVLKNGIGRKLLRGEELKMSTLEDAPTGGDLCSLVTVMSSHEHRSATVKRFLNELVGDGDA